MEGGLPSLPPQQPVESRLLNLEGVTMATTQQKAVEWVKGKKTSLILATVAAMGMGVGGYYYLDKQADQVKAATPIPMEEAMAKGEGSPVLVEFSPKGSRNFGNFTLLNEQQYKGPGTQGRTVFVPKTAKGYDLVSDPVGNSQVGKHLKIKGHLGKDPKGQPQVVADEVSLVTAAK